MRSKAGFTLIELSIVLVIIGLIIGGVLVGRDLIKAAELRSVITDVESFKAAVFTFKQKYGCLPGDCPNATDFFGAANSDNAQCLVIDTPNAIGNTATCNGSGTGVIQAPTVSIGGWQNYYISLPFRFWQQLADSGMIPGHYTGIADTSICPIGVYCADIAIGQNVPASKITGAGYAIRDCTTLLGTAIAAYPVAAVLKNCFQFGNTTRVTNPGDVVYTDRWSKIDALGPALTVADAMVIDTKADDGVPSKGIITVPASNSWNVTPHCTTGASSGYDSDPDAAVYNTAYSSIACSLIFDPKF